MIAEQHLQRMLAGLEVQFGFGPAVSEVDIILVRGNRHAEIGQFGVDNDVMMTRMRDIVAGRRNDDSWPAPLREIPDAPGDDDDDDDAAGNHDDGGDDDDDDDDDYGWWD